MVLSLLLLLVQHGHGQFVWWRVTSYTSLPGCATNSASGIFAYQSGNTACAANVTCAAVVTAQRTYYETTLCAASAGVQPTFPINTWTRVTHFANVGCVPSSADLVSVYAAGCVAYASGGSSLIGCATTGGVGMQYYPASINCVGVGGGITTFAVGVDGVCRTPLTPTTSSLYVCGTGGIPNATTAPAAAAATITLPPTILFLLLLSLVK